ncbi:hypothetical protein [Streptomyces sp. SR-10]|uniref:hypothetical protein n=1 Tax=Streptomyces sp. SR-10 TaxID=3416442 RepID=UPI003CF2299F
MAGERGASDGTLTPCRLLGSSARPRSTSTVVVAARKTSCVSSVFVMVECRSVSGLHAYVTDELAALHGITRIESAATQRRTKRAGPLPAPLAEKRAGAPSGRAAAQ